MNRLFARRLVINTFWSVVYIVLVGYVAFVNLTRHAKKLDSVVVRAASSVGNSTPVAI
jgi:flagellar biosynthesis protein FlhB